MSGAVVADAASCHAITRRAARLKFEISSRLSSSLVAILPQALLSCYYSSQPNTEICRRWADVYECKGFHTVTGSLSEANQRFDCPLLQHTDRSLSPRANACDDSYQPAQHRFSTQAKKSARPAGRNYNCNRVLHDMRKPVVQNDPSRRALIHPARHSVTRLPH